MGAGVSAPNTTEQIMKTTDETHSAGSPWALRDAAKWLGISERHLRRLIDLGKVKSISLGRRVFISAAELRRIAAEGVA
jgi:excisionase family DNA binding protein